MTSQVRFNPGQTIVLREMWDGKIWSARPAIVVQDEPELMAFYIPTGTAVRVHIAPNGSPAIVDNRARSDWILEQVEWPEFNRLKLVIPGTGYSVILFKDSKDYILLTWYINLEDPLGRIGLGYDSIDLLLDITVSPDLSEWHWHDEDELEEAVSAGLISSFKTKALYTEGERVVTWLQSGKSPFNGWGKWRPDPSWQIPVLPDGWDIVN